jgi:hypothetical protein
MEPLDGKAKGPTIINTVAESIVYLVLAYQWITHKTHYAVPVLVLPTFEVYL